MSDKDLGEGIEKFEEEVEGLKNKEFRLFGIKMTAMTISAAFAIISAGLGSLYGAFEVYKDYMEMKEQIQSYVAPDLSGFQEQLSVMKKDMEATKASVQEATSYTNEIKNDLKSDIRRVEKVVEGVERSTKEQQRQVDADLKVARNEMRDLQKEVDRGLKEVKTDLEKKLKEALDNPLAGN